MDSGLERVLGTMRATVARMQFVHFFRCRERYTTTMQYLLIVSLILGASESEKNAEPRPTGVRVISPTLRVDFDHSQVILDGEVVLREGALELLVCPKGTKEHETIVAAEVEPKSFHLALLLVGAKPGRPAEFEPYKPPTGQKIHVEFEFAVNGKQERVDARRWIRDIQTGKEIDADFVFAGSRFLKIPGEERAVWQGDDGDLVCVTNFVGSIIDVAVQSSTDNANLSFEAWTDRIPPKGTKVRVRFTPLPDAKPTPKPGPAVEKK